MSWSMHRSPAIRGDLDKVLAREITPADLRKGNGDLFDVKAFSQDSKWAQLHTEVVGCQSRGDFQTVSGRVEKEWNRQKGWTDHKKPEYQVTFCAIRKVAEKHGCELHMPSCCRDFTDQGPRIAQGTVLYQVNTLQ